MLPYVRIGGGATRVVIVSGGDAFVRRFDEASAMRSAQRIARIFPASCTLYILGYDASTQPSAQQLTETIAEFIRDELGRAVIAGISFGGFLATRVAAAHPELADALILISSTPRFSAEGSQRISRQIDAIARDDFAAMARPFVTLFRRTRLNLAARIGLWLRRRSIAARMNDPQFVEHMLKLALTCSDALPLDAVHVPALVVIGERDQFFDVTAAQVESIAGETHMVAVERPDLVQRAIDAFLTRRLPAAVR
jgi:pimeloyl-ACP methyl ester carboxylesterase